MKITDLLPENEPALQQAAVVLVAGFKDNPAYVPDIESALVVVRKAVQPGRICRVALDENEVVVGWVGGISGYGGLAWELHPLVVDPVHQGRGVGQALVADLEERVRERGGLTVHLGTDDEDYSTSLSGTDLYPDVLRHLAGIRNLRRHPYEFYQKLGYVIVGAIPDANGFGKPDILMAKRVGKIDTESV